MLFLSEFYQNIFGTKTYKLSLDAGCTCPNRDGFKGTGGCIFCSQNGSGDFTPDKNLSIKEQIFYAKKKVESKIKGRSGTRTGKYIAYLYSSYTGKNDSRLTEKKNLARILFDDVQDKIDGSGLARTVLSDEAAYGSLGYRKAYIIKFEITVILGDILKFNNVLNFVH